MINKEEKKPIILCLVGRSGCGKTTASLWLQKHFSDVNTIISCTTRPMRYGETNGVEHLFIKYNGKNIPSRSQMLAYTRFGNYEYWTEFSDIKQDKINIYVIDEKGINDLIINHGDKFQIFVCQIGRPGQDGADSDRLERDKERAPLLLNCPHWYIDNNSTIETLYQKMSEVVFDLIIYKL